MYREGKAMLCENVSGASWMVRDGQCLAAWEGASSCKAQG